MSTTPPVPDARTYNRKLLDQIRALLQGKALDDVAMYKIGGRELTHIPLEELLRWEAAVEARVINERRRKAGLPRRGSLVLFGGADTQRLRFVGLRLLIGRLLIALMSDPSDRKPEPISPVHVVARHEPKER